MKIKITAVGALAKSLPHGQVVIEGREFTIQGILNTLVSKYGKVLMEELFNNGKIKKEISVLINGRNANTLPDKFEALLKDKDEIIITAYITGG